MLDRAPHHIPAGNKPKMAADAIIIITTVNVIVIINPIIVIVIINPIIIIIGASHSCRQ